MRSFISPPSTPLHSISFHWVMHIISCLRRYMGASLISFDLFYHILLYSIIIILCHNCIVLLNTIIPHHSNRLNIFIIHSIDILIFFILRDSYFCPSCKENDFYSFFLFQSSFHFNNFLASKGYESGRGWTDRQRCKSVPSLNSILCIQYSPI